MAEESGAVTIGVGETRKKPGVVSEEGAASSSADDGFVSARRPLESLLSDTDDVYATATSAFASTTDDDVSADDGGVGGGISGADASGEDGVTSPDIPSDYPDSPSHPMASEDSREFSSVDDVESSPSETTAAPEEKRRASGVVPFDVIDVAGVAATLTVSLSMGGFESSEVLGSREGMTGLSASRVPPRATASAHDLPSSVDAPSDLSSKLRESMFTVDNIDFDEPLVDPAEKYRDILYPVDGAEEAAAEEATVLTCVDNPNLETECVLKNSNAKITLTLSSDGLRWELHSVPTIPTKVKEQMAQTPSGSLLKVKFQTSSITSYMMSCGIPLEDVVIAKVGHWTSHEKYVRKSDKTVTVFALDKRPHGVWAYCPIHFECDSTVTSKVWVHTINRHLLERFPRPKCLLVFVNPIGGKGNALSIFKKQVAPLFDLAQIETEVIISKGGSYIEDFLAVFRFGTIDGVLAVGGDGTFSQVVNGLLKRAQKDEERVLDLPPSSHPLNKNTPSPLATPAVPVGHIPAGSQNTLAYSTLGAMDPTTSALHVILGTRMGLDVMAVHDFFTGKFLRFSNVILAYGSAADCAVESDRNRWMGPWRYLLAGAKILQRHRMYYGRLEYLPATHSGHAADGVRCWSGCGVCEAARKYCRDEGWGGGDGGGGGENEGGKDKEVEEKSETNWKSLSVKFHSIMAIPLTARTRLRAEGDLPFTHLADGTTELVLVSECTRRDVVKMAGKGGVLGSRSVTPYRVRAFRFVPLDEKMEDVLTPIGRGEVRGGGAAEEDEAPEEEAVEVKEDEEGARRPNGHADHLTNGLAPAETLSVVDAGGVMGAPESPASTPPPDAWPSPAPMTSSSSFTGDSSGPASRRPDCLTGGHAHSAHSSSRKDLSCWTSDGEMDFGQKAIVCFVHCQLLTIFGHGVEKPQ